MVKLSMYARERVVSLHSSGKNVTQIKKMLECEGIKTSRLAVSLFLSRYQNTGSLRDAKRSGRKSKLQNEHVNFIDNALSENNQLT